MQNKGPEELLVFEFISLFISNILKYHDKFLDSTLLWALHTGRSPTVISLCDYLSVYPCMH